MCSVCVCVCVCVCTCVGVDGCVHALVKTIEWKSNAHCMHDWIIQLLELFTEP